MKRLPTIKVLSTTATIFVWAFISLQKKAYAANNACPPGGMNTAIGKIPCTPQGLAAKIFSLALGIAGGIALMLIIAGGYRIIVSQGDPEAIMGGKEMITSAIAGLLFIIFSAAILRIIGCNILGLPCD